MRPAYLVLALVSAIACGGASPGDPAPPAGDGGDAPGGSGAGGAGSPVAGPISFEVLDAGGECAGLVPAGASSPFTIRVTPPPGGSCLGGTSDGTGAVAVGVRAASGEVTWHAHAPDGAARGRFEADPPLVPEPSGWHALVSTGPQGAFDPTVEHVALAPDGSVARRVAVSPDPSVAVYPRWDLSPDPAGGCLVAIRSSALAGNHWSSVTAHRFDASGAAARPGGERVTLDESASEPMFLAGGVSTRGDAVIVSQDSAFLDVSWLDRAGAVLAGASADKAERSADVVGETLQPDLDLVPLLDGSVAVRADGSFRRIYAHLATTTSPLPAWLADRASSSFRFTRGNAGYAVFPPAGAASPDCTQRIDLVSPGGRLCGRVVLREDAAACTAGAVDQGWDGTVVQQSGKDPCTYRVWSRLLAR